MGRPAFEYEDDGNEPECKVQAVWLYDDLVERPALVVENDESLSVCKFQAGWCLKHDTALSRSAPRVRKQKLMTFYAGEELDKASGVVCTVVSQANKQIRDRGQGKIKGSNSSKKGVFAASISTHVPRETATGEDKRSALHFSRMAKE